MKPGLLQSFINENETRMLKPGEWDCALCAAEWVKISTGRDLAHEYRGRYKTMKAGQKLIAAQGFEDHIAMAAAYFREIHPAFAQIGDLAAVGEALGIVAGEHVFVLRETGFGVVMLEQADRAFEVR
jgi:hypothetical protein